MVSSFMVPRSLSLQTVSINLLYYFPLVSPLLISSVYGTHPTTCLRLSSSIISTLITWIGTGAPFKCQEIMCYKSCSGVHGRVDSVGKQAKVCCRKKIQFSTYCPAYCKNTQLNYQDDW